MSGKKRDSIPETIPVERFMGERNLDKINPGGDLSSHNSDHGSSHKGNLVRARRS